MAGQNMMSMFCVQMLRTLVFILHIIYTQLLQYQGVFTAGRTLYVLPPRNAWWIPCMYRPVTCVVPNLHAWIRIH